MFIAVGTPSRQGDGHADLGWVYSAAQEIAANLKGFAVVVAKSTVPIGTGDEVERLIRESNVDADVRVASTIRNFFVKERLMSDFKHPDRIVVGDR